MECGTWEAVVASLPMRCIRLLLWYYQSDLNEADLGRSKSSGRHRATAARKHLSVSSRPDQTTNQRQERAKKVWAVLRFLVPKGAYQVGETWKPRLGCNGLDFVRATSARGVDCGRAGQMFPKAKYP